MTQGEECFGHIARHGDVNVRCVVVPVNFESKVTGPGPVLGERIFGGKSGEKMLSVGLRKNLMPKSSTARVKVVRRSVWRQRPGV